jgi:TolB-like protein/DNA-binding winged helix-turn-helix (wHTH) protein/Tfp pilus assembly protein PilF
VPIPSPRELQMSRQVLRFGEFELDPESGDLLRGGEPVHLAPQPFKILALLAGRAGEPVAREELRREVWGEETYVDFDRGLNFCISQIRTALGDDAQEPLFIQTLPRRGYRFVAPVERVERAGRGPATALRPDVEPPAPLPDSRIAPGRLSAGSRVATLGFLLAGMAAMAVLIAFVAWRRQGPPAEPRVMIAVLPFEDLSAGPSEPYWSDGLTGELIAQLGRLQPRRLGVIARTSVMSYALDNKGKHRDVAEIGGELGVSYLLEGSVRRAGERVRITAQLVQVSDGTQLWAETYDRDRRDVLAVQTEVAAEVARALALALLPESARAPQPAPDPAAWDDYLKGRYLANRGARDDLARSLVPLRRAVERDPAFAPAHAALADSYHRLVMSGALPPRTGYPQAEAAARQAVALAPDLAEAHAALAAALFWYRWDWPAAEREFRRALELNPSLPQAHHDYGFFLIARGRPGEGLAEVERARQLDPLSPRANIDVGWAFISARRYAEAVAQSRRTLELAPGFPEARFCLEQALAFQGKDREALRSRSLQQLGKMEAAAARGEPVSAISLATLYAAVGNRDRAFAWLDKALEERSPSLALLAVHPSWDSLRSDPRFAALAARIRR